MILSLPLNQLPLQVIILFISLSDVPFENGVFNVYSSFHLPFYTNIHVDSSNISLISSLLASAHLLKKLRNHEYDCCYCTIV